MLTYLVREGIIERKWFNVEWENICTPVCKNLLTCKLKELLSIVIKWMEISYSYRFGTCNPVSLDLGIVPRVILFANWSKMNMIVQTLKNLGTFQVCSPLCNLFVGH